MLAGRFPHSVWMSSECDDKLLPGLATAGTQEDNSEVVQDANAADRCEKTGTDGQKKS